MVPGISDKMLTQRLRELVENGLVLHDGESYRLSERGESARDVLGALYAWGRQMAPEVDAFFPENAAR